MAQNFNLKNLSLDSMKNKIKDLKKKISGNYLCIEFGYNYIQIAEAYYSKGCVGYKKVLKKYLPSEALDKGIPSEPDTMASLISKILEEQNINIKRTAITLSTESIYTRLIEIPKKISEEKVIDFLLDPSSLVQIPISIEKTDFNVFKTSYQLNEEKNCATYFFMAMPKTSINNLVLTCERAQLDLLYVESGANSILKLLTFKSLFNENENQTFLILLDLLSNCTQLTLIDQSGPIYCNRLTSIRNYEIVSDSEFSGGSKDQYLPITKLDLKVLIKEIKRDIRNFFQGKNVEFSFKILLAGPNSSHPNLTKILSESINLPTYLISPSGSSNIIDVKLEDDALLESNFTKIFGLGIGLLDHDDQLLINRLERNTNSFLEFIEQQIPIKPISLLRNTNKNQFNNSKNADQESDIFKNEPNQINTKISKKNQTKKESNYFSNSKANTENKNLKVDNEISNSNEQNIQKEELKNYKSNEDENQDNTSFKLDTDFLDLD